MTASQLGDKKIGELGNSSNRRLGKWSIGQLGNEPINSIEAIHNHLTI